MLLPLLGLAVITIAASVASAAWLGGALFAGADAGRRVNPAALVSCQVDPVTARAAPQPGAWWKLQEQLDANGALVGRQLFVGRGNRPGATIRLAVESAASGPVGGVVVASSDDGRTSTLRLVSTDDGCSWLAFETSSVVRGAILEPSTGAILAHLVDRASRADLGTWRVGGPGSATVAAELIAGPLRDPPVGAGPAWVTTLRLDRSGRQLAVQTCFEPGCLTRIFDVAKPGAALARIDAPDQGSLVDFDPGRLLTWAACSGLPCDVTTWSVPGAASTALVHASRSVGVSADGRVLLAAIDPPGGLLRIDLQTGVQRRVKPLAAGQTLLDVGPGAESGLEVSAAQLPIAIAGGQPQAFDPTAAEVLP